MPANNDPIFGLTPNVGTGSLWTANANRNGTGTIATVFTAGASGSRIEEVTIKAWGTTGDPADSTVVFWLHDGSNLWLFDEWDLGDPAAGSATVSSYQEKRTYPNLLLPTGWTYRASITAAPTTGSVHVVCLGYDY